MSLLGTPVYANPTTPLWVSAGGGSSSGTISATEFDALASGGFVVKETNGNSKLRLANDAAGNSLIQSTDVIKFTQIGTIQGNSQLTTSAFGANVDALLVRGSITATGNLNGIGPNPTQIITAVQNITPVSGTVQYFTQTTPYASVTGGEYDIMTRGEINLTGTPAAGDYVVITVQVGTSGNSNWNYYFYPGITGAMDWAVRDRMPCDAGRAAIRVGVSVILGGGSTATYSVSQSQFDVTRVL
jgi:hypothetical protein